MGLAVIRWDTGRQIFECIGDKVSKYLSFADAGSAFVYGYLSDQQPFVPENIQVQGDPNRTEAYTLFAAALNTPDGNGNYPVSTIFIFKTLSAVYFFSFCVSMLYYAGILQWIICKEGSVGQSFDIFVKSPNNLFQTTFIMGQEGNMELLSKDKCGANFKHWDEKNSKYLQLLENTVICKSIHSNAGMQVGNEKRVQEGEQ